MNVEKVIRECHKDVAQITLRTLSAIRQKQTNKQPIEMEKSTPKPTTKKRRKIDVAIENTQLEIDTYKYEIKQAHTKIEALESVLKSLELIKNKTDLI